MTLSPSPAFLLVDDRAEGEQLISKTLRQAFPRADVVTCRDALAAMKIVRTLRISAAIVHRAKDADGIALVTQLRTADPELPILLLAGWDQREETALAAGATRFLHWVEWLHIPAAITAMLAPALNKAGA